MINRQVVSVSLSKKSLGKLNKIQKEVNKSRSKIIQELIDKYEEELGWEQIRKWGRETAKKYNIKSEEDILRIIND